MKLRNKASARSPCWKAGPASRSFRCPCTACLRARRSKPRMLEIPGPPALSAFRITKLLKRVQGLEPTVAGLSARFVHFADLARPLTAPELEGLARLPTYGPSGAAGTEEAEPGERLLIVPRAGTISAWSSKATDIVQVCGLRSVRRVERGIAYRVRTARAL